MQNEAAKKIKVAVGLSGGVDSSVAAFLLVKQGYDVTGVHMRCWDYNAPGCHGNEDRADAVKVAALLGIPFVNLDFEREYKDTVLKYFYSEIEAGRTPNPDVMCNKEIKFGLFLEWAQSQGFDYIATGHYARISKHLMPEGEVFSLLSGVDAAKDQSYFLYRLNQSQLAKSLFPVGEYTKPAIRKMAKEQGFGTADKPDSTGICFIGDIDISDFIKKRVKVVKGKVLDTRGEVIGEHDGAQLYTVGQRKGFTVTRYSGMPLYVLSKNVEDNTITVGLGKDAQVKNFEVTDLSWINPRDPRLDSPTLNCQVRIRNLGDKAPSVISDPKTLQASSTLKVILDDYLTGVAPGQSAVFYCDDEVLGGGVIV